MSLDITLTAIRPTEVFGANITHNLFDMAKEAGLGEYIWQPEKLGITKAEQLIEPLTNGLFLLKSDPDRFKELNPKNNWGSYTGLIIFVENYLDACIKNPDATIKAER